MRPQLILSSQTKSGIASNGRSGQTIASWMCRHTPLALHERPRPGKTWTGRVKPAARGDPSDPRSIMVANSRSA